MKIEKLNRVVIYTALFGDYDYLIEPSKKFLGCDFVCFTDQKNLKSDIWDIRIVTDCDMPSNMMNRKYKILPHRYLSDYEYSIYIDANIKVMKSPVELISKYLNDDNFALPRHFSRNCIYQEAKECIVLQKDLRVLIVNQMKIYRQLGMPKEYGLGENNILFRRHNESLVVNIMQVWWAELNNGSRRDQLSLAFVMWRFNKRFRFIEESPRVDSLYFGLYPHKSFQDESYFLHLINAVKVYMRKLFFFLFPPCV